MIELIQHNMAKRKAQAEHETEDLLYELLSSSGINLYEQSPAKLRWKKAENKLYKLKKGADAFNSSRSKFTTIDEKCGLILDDGEFAIAMDALLESCEKEMSNERGVFGGNDVVLSREFVLSLQEELTTTPNQVPH